MYETEEKIHISFFFLSLFVIGLIIWSAIQFHYETVQRAGEEGGRQELAKLHAQIDTKGEASLGDIILIRKPK